MPRRILGIVESAYRATIEEQDDTVVWFTHAVKAGGGDVSLLLRGNGVNYAVRGQDASGVQIGDWKQTQPPDVARDLASLLGRGGAVYVVADDLATRGVSRHELLEGVEPIGRDEVAALVARHDAIWHW